MLTNLHATAILFLTIQSLGSCQTTTTSAPASTPTCGFKGWDKDGTNIGYYGDPLSATYASCNALCNANAACLSFAVNSVACILYDYPVVGNDVADANSPNTFYDRGGVCPVTTTSTSSTTTTPAATPTCSGFVGWDKDGTNIGYYADAASATYGGCLSLCNANAACLSFGLTPAPACILYNHPVADNIADPNSGNTFYDRGGICPATPTTTSSTAVPTQTGAFQDTIFR